MTDMNRIIAQNNYLYFTKKLFDIDKRFKVLITLQWKSKLNVALFQISFLNFLQLTSSD